MYLLFVQIQVKTRKNEKTLTNMLKIKIIGSIKNLRLKENYEIMKIVQYGYLSFDNNYLGIYIKKNAINF